MKPTSLPKYIPHRFSRIHLELTNKCNFSCLFCPDRVMTRERGFMDRGLAKSALDQIAELDLADKVTFHVMGEPLLHPQFEEILDHAGTRGIPVGLTTNGALLTQETIEFLASRDLHQIDISLQSPDAESFAATRGTRMDFGRYRDRVLDLAAATRKRPEPPIFKIRIMTTRFAGALRTKLGIPDFMGSSRELRRTILEWSALLYAKLGLPREDLTRLERELRKVKIYAWNVIEIQPKLFFETYVLTDWGNAFADEDIIEANKGYCFGMRDHFAVLFNGDVVLCCVDYEGNTAIGNLNDGSLVEILSKPELREIMEGFEKNRLTHPYCRRCLGSRTHIGARTKPYLSVLGLKVLKPFFYRTYRLYEESR